MSPNFPFQITIPIPEICDIRSKNPLVSIIVITYNQEKYIEQCIQSILDQKTNFSFEIILGEDASTDTTRAICEKLQKQNSEKIRLFLHHSENKIKDKLGNPSGKLNLLYSISQCKGKYIAICEGDDYWTDSLKLQKQVNFLENNSDYVAVFTDFDKLNNNTGKIKSNFNQKRFNLNCNLDITSKDLFSKNLKYLRTLTSIFKAEILKSFNFYYLYSAGDTQWIFHSLQQGKIHYMNFSSGVYRVQDESTSKSKSFEKKQLFLENYVKFLQVIKKDFQLTLKDKRYIQKTILMSTLRRSAHEKNNLRFFITSLRLIFSFHWSRNIKSNLTYLLRRSNSIKMNQNKDS